MATDTGMTMKTTPTSRYAPRLLKITATFLACIIMVPGSAHADTLSTQRTNTAAGQSGDESTRRHGTRTHDTKTIPSAPSASLHFDVVVYGATSGGVIAALSASRHTQQRANKVSMKNKASDFNPNLNSHTSNPNPSYPNANPSNPNPKSTPLRVGLVVANGGGCGPSEAGANHVGGMTTGGLGKTDIGAAETTHLVGGIAGEFYSRVAQRYNTTAPPHYNHEPHVAQQVFDEMLNESTVQLVWGGHGANIQSATKQGTDIVSITLMDGTNLTASVFIDASYEGDLLAAAGGSWVVGREAQATYNESTAGRQPGDSSNFGYEFKIPVDPFDASGALLPLLESGPVGVPGQGDSHVQAYNFRLCATSSTQSGARASFPLPDPASTFSNPSTWTLARRVFADPTWRQGFSRPGCSGDDFPCFDAESPPLNPVTGHKRDWNNPFLGPLNTDCVTGCNQSGYPTADYPGRLAIWEAHRQYYLSLLHFYQFDPAVPETVRNRVASWGLCADEFVDTDHWPPQLYTRETRRMVGDRVFTQNDPVNTPCWGHASIGVGDYTFDSHPAQRFACRGSDDERCRGAVLPWLKPGQKENRSFAWSEGNVQQTVKPYSIPYWVMTPKRSELSNLLVTATPSGSHIGFSSLRMEPQFMVIGHAAGTAAALYARNASSARAVQDMDMAVLSSTLVSEKQIIKPPTCP
eukprot:m.196160 g.196160  ORF g.196160 m.196160 type:complete len:693 (-) comp19704_c0_seq1:6-2084(-)